MTPAWMTVSLLTPVLFALIALAVVAARGTTVIGPLWTAAGKPAWWLDLAIGSLLYGIGEEPGWRGWLLPRLEQRHTLVLPSSSAGEAFDCGKGQLPPKPPNVLRIRLPDSAPHECLIR